MSWRLKRCIIDSSCISIFRSYFEAYPKTSSIPSWRVGSPATRACRAGLPTQPPDNAHSAPLTPEVTPAGDGASAGAQLLQLAKTTWARGLSWWWLTERLLELAAAACSEASGGKQDGGLCEASVALAHGTFLLYQCTSGKEGRLAPLVWQ